MYNCGNCFIQQRVRCDELLVGLEYSSVYNVCLLFDSWLISILASLVGALRNDLQAVIADSFKGCRIMINLERYWKPSRTLFEPTMILTELSSAFLDEESNCTSEFNQSRSNELRLH